MLRTWSRRWGWGSLVLVACGRAPGAGVATVVEVRPAMPAGVVEDEPDPESKAGGGVVDPIDDCEDGNNQVLLTGGRSGYWYTYADESGSTLTPLPGVRGGVVTMSQPGRSGSTFALHLEGRVSDASIAFVGAGLNFLDPRSAYDVTPHSGVVFWARRGRGMLGSLRVKLPDRRTAPDGGVCTECFNDFGANVELSEGWREYRLRFDDMEQIAGWGSPRPDGIDLNAVYGILFEFAGRSGEFDLWIDDVAFLSD